MIPRVSIVMPCYNAESHLPGSIGSMLAQSFRDWELIVVDDGSRDGTRDWLATHRDPRIIVITQSNQGVSGARNRGLAQCKGEYIGFLDADDTWDREFLSTLVAELDAHPEMVLAYCGWQNLGLPGKRGESFIPPDYEGADKMRFLIEGCRWPIHACLTRRDVVTRAGGFDSELKIGEDFLLWMEVGQLGSILRIPKVLAYYHHHSNTQATKDKVRTALDTLKAKRKFLTRHPTVARRLGAEWVESVTWRHIIAQANELYWRGDMASARILYLRVLLGGRSGGGAKFRMIFCLLPSRLQRVVRNFVDRMRHDD